MKKKTSKTKPYNKINKKNKNIKKKQVKKNSKGKKNSKKQVTTFKEKVINVLTNRFIFNGFYLSISIFIMEMYLRFMVKSSFADFSVVRILLSSFIIGNLISYFTRLLPKLAEKIVNSIILGIIGIYIFIEYELYCVIGFFMGVGNASQGTKVVEYIKDVAKTMEPIDLTILIFPIVLIVGFILIRKYIIDKYSKEVPKRLRLNFTLLITVILIFVSTFYYAIVRNERFQNKLQAESNYALWLYPENTNLTVNNFGSLMYIFLDIKNQITGIDAEYILAMEAKEETSNDVTTAEVTDYTREIDDTAWNELISNTSNSTYNTLNNYFINRTITDKNEMTGIYEGKNLIVILLESVDEISILNEEDFPTLYKLYHEGITFTNNYSPKNSCSTGNNEFTALTSLFTINNTCTANSYATKTTYPEALFNMFNEYGYYSTSYHDYTAKYYYRDSIHKNLGSSKYYDVTALGIKYYEPYAEWPSDVDMFTNAKQYYMDSDKFVAYFATVTTHRPYYESSTEGDRYMNDWPSTYSAGLRRYLSKMKVLDNALSLLLSQLEEEGKLDDTVIAMFGDHYPYGLTDSDINAYLSANNAGYTVNRNSTTDKNVDRTPMIIYNSATEPQQVTSYTTMIDLLPTLLNMFGIDYDPRLYLGTDIFSDSHVSRAYFSDGSWQDENAFYYAPTGKITYFGDVTYTAEEIAAINKEIVTRQKMSASAITSNYFSYLYEGLKKYSTES